MLRVARIEREDEAVEKAPPIARGFDEQPVHRRGQPQHRQPFAKRRRRRRGAIDPHNPSPGIRRFDPGPQRHRRQVGTGLHLGKDRKPSARAVAHHVGERRPAQPAPRREQRNRLQDIGLAGAIVAMQRDEPRRRCDVRTGMIAKIGQRKAGERHLPVRLPQPLFRCQPVARPGSIDIFPVIGNFSHLGGFFALK